MKRSDLAHILLAASTITGDPDIIVLGSQSILGRYSHIALPEAATRSIEADIMFVNDPDGHKGDLVDGSIGELSHFQESFGIYGQGWLSRPGKHHHHHLNQPQATLVSYQRRTWTECRRERRALASSDGDPGDLLTSTSAQIRYACLRSGRSTVCVVEFDGSDGLEQVEVRVVAVCAVALGAGHLTKDVQFAQPFQSLVCCR